MDYKLKNCPNPVVDWVLALHLSMIDNPFPSRADVSDVANAIYDGSDVVMLSGETSVGHYPVQCVQMMAQIAGYIEGTERYQSTNKTLHGLR